MPTNDEIPARRRGSKPADYDWVSATRTRVAQLYEALAYAPADATTTCMRVVIERLLPDLEELDDLMAADDRRRSSRPLRVKALTAYVRDQRAAVEHARATDLSRLRPAASRATFLVSHYALTLGLTGSVSDKFRKRAGSELMDGFEGGAVPVSRLVKLALQTQGVDAHTASHWLRDRAKKRPRDRAKS